MHIHAVIAKTLLFCQRRYRHIYLPDGSAAAACWLLQTWLITRHRRIGRDSKLQSAHPKLLNIWPIWCWIFTLLP